MCVQAILEECCTQLSRKWESLCTLIFWVRIVNCAMLLQSKVTQESTLLKKIILHSKVIFLQLSMRLLIGILNSLGLGFTIHLVKFALYKLSSKASKTSTWVTYQQQDVQKNIIRVAKRMNYLWSQMTLMLSKFVKSALMKVLWPSRQ